MTIPETTTTREPANGVLLLPYFGPYAAYVLIANFGSSLPRTIDYAIRIIVTAALLWYFRKRYQPLRGPLRVSTSVLFGIAAGLAGVVLWILLLLPFRADATGESFTSGAFLMRIVAAATVVPLAEELLCRGYILGAITQWQEARRSGSKQAVADALDRKSVRSITPGAATALAVILSSVAFAAGHTPAQWLAAFGYGVAMAMLWIVRRDLITPIVAHAVTNVVLYAYIWRTNSWWLW